MVATTEAKVFWQFNVVVVVFLFIFFELIEHWWVLFHGCSYQYQYLHFSLHIWFFLFHIHRRRHRYSIDKTKGIWKKNIYVYSCTSTSTFTMLSQTNRNVKNADKINCVDQSSHNQLKSFTRHIQDNQNNENKKKKTTAHLKLCTFQSIYTSTCTQIQLRKREEKWIVENFQRTMYYAPPFFL